MLIDSRISGSVPLATVSALGALFLNGCSTAPTMPPKAWAIDPVIAIQHATRDADTYYQLGRYHDGQNRLAVAIAAYRVAVAANPGHGAAWNGLGTALAKSGKIAEAIDALEKATAALPKASHVQNNLGYALMLAGRDEEAVASLRRAVDLDRDNRLAWRNLENAYGRLGERQQAMMAKNLADNGKAASAPVSQASVAPPPPAAVPEAAEQPGSVLVQVAENVFELRAPVAARPDAATEAATIIKAATAPVAAVFPVVGGRVALSADALPPVGRAAPAVVDERQAPPSPAVAPAPVPAKPQLVARVVRYEITNGQGGEGLARRLAGLLGREGFDRPRLTNHKSFDQMLSYVEYREGFRDAAAAFAERLPFRTELRLAPAALVTDVRLMLGKDLNLSDACSVLGLCSRYARTPALPQAQSQGFTRTRDTSGPEWRRSTNPI